jgi:hypothetical protein
VGKSATLPVDRRPHADQATLRPTPRRMRAQRACCSPRLRAAQMRGAAALVLVVGGDVADAGVQADGVVLPAHVGEFGRLCNFPAKCAKSDSARCARFPRKAGARFARLRVLPRNQSRSLTSPAAASSRGSTSPPPASAAFTSRRKRRRDRDGGVLAPRPLSPASCALDDGRQDGPTSLRWSVPPGDSG